MDETQKRQKKDDEKGEGGGFGQREAESIED